MHRRARNAGVFLVLLLGLYTLAWLVTVDHLSFSLEGRRYFTLWDDTMISMRYAYNLAHGNGLVWNAGDRVQGYTNLGWTLWLALIDKAGLPLRQTSLPVQLSNLLVIAALMSLAYVYLIRRGAIILAVLAAVLLALNPSLFWWGVAGTESPLQALLVTLAFLPLLPLSAAPPQADKNRAAQAALLPLLGSLAFFVRADGIVFVAVGIVAGIWLLTVARSSRSSAGVFVACCVLSCLLVAFILLWQNSYYGSFLPNTFAVKASGDARRLSTGLQYLADYVNRDAQLVLLLAPAIMVVRGLARQGERQAWAPIILLLGGWLFYIVWVGGDHFLLGRFLLPVLPVLCVLTADCLLHFTRQGLLLHFDPAQASSIPFAGVLRPAVVVAAVIALLALLGLRGFTTDVHGKAWNYERTAVALGLNRALVSPNSVIGVFASGCTAYFMPDYRFHDMLGKSDRHIAQTTAKDTTAGHSKWDYDYSLSTIAPNIIVSGYTYTDMTDESAAAWIRRGEEMIYFPSLWLNPLFRQTYRINQIPVIIKGQKAKLVDVYAGSQNELKVQTLVIN